MEQILEARRTGRLHEMWGCGTAAGVAAIGELGWRGERIVVGDGGEGPLARRLGSTLREIQTGAAPDPDGWMTEARAHGQRRLNTRNRSQRLGSSTGTPASRV